MEEIKKQYLLFLSEIIAKMAVIFGPDITIQKARSVEGLVLDGNGNVTDINGYMTDKTEELINGYMRLSGSIVKKNIDSIIAKYPQIKRAG